MTRHNVSDAGDNDDNNMAAKLNNEVCQVKHAVIWPCSISCYP